MTTLAIGYIYRGTVHHSFMLSLIRYLEYDRNKGQDARMAALIGVEGLYLAQSRNEVVSRFLLTAADWLLFIDTDIDFVPGQVDHLLNVAEGVGEAVLFAEVVPVPAYPIVAAFYPTVIDGEITATWHSEIAAPSRPVTSVVTNELQPIAACGMGFTLIHRQVLIALPEPFGHHPVDGYQSGEDVTACLRWKRLGYQIMGYGMGVGHTKAHRLTLDQWRSE